MVAENQQVVILVLFLIKRDVRIDVNSLWCDRAAAAGPQLLTTQQSKYTHTHFHLQLSGLSVVRAATARLPFGYVIRLILMNTAICVCTPSVTCTTYHHYEWFVS